MRLTLLACLGLAVAGCAHERKPAKSVQVTPLAVDVSAPTAHAALRAAPGDLTPREQKAIDALIPADPIDVALPPQPLPELINTVFGDVLKVPYVVGPQIATRTDVVALRSVRGMSKRSFFRLMQLALRQYGLRADIVGGVVNVVVDTTANVPPSLVLQGRPPPPPPAGEPQASQLFEAKSIQVEALLSLMAEVFPHSGELTLTADDSSNSLVVSGPPREVANAVAALQDLDQPKFSGASVMQAQPVFWSADSLAGRLSNALEAEGIFSQDAPGAPRSALVLAMPDAGQVLIFSKDPAVMQRARFWLGQLDQADAFSGGDNTFIYQVQNTDAKALAKLVTDEEDHAAGPHATQPQPGAPGAPPATAAALSAAMSSSAVPVAAGALPGAPGGQAEQVSGEFHGGRIVVDDVGNRILFTGPAEAFSQLRSLLVSLDSEPRQVLVEVTIAEVTLTDQTSIGLEWFFQHSMAGGLISGGTQGGLGLPTNGLNLQFVGKNLNAAFDTYASNNNVNILSRPRLVARTGVEAHIEVGTDVPIITSQMNAPTTTSGSTDILQTITYRQTGIILHIKPTIYGDHHVNLEVTQEVSSEQANPNAAIGSPEILDRNVGTELSLDEGTTAVLGGLIDTNYTKGNNGVPLLKDVPLLGEAFRTDTVSASKTELVVLVTPHILRSGEDMAPWSSKYATEMNEAFRTGVSPWSRILTPYDKRKDLKIDAPTPPDATAPSATPSPATP